ncbi:MAG: hypothetical protein LBM02_06460 [Lachnospiraceae bacterium]|jgi:septal ring factor EnvC (AmiA/AmiB activator)|nr:hypothetical protein [Lachnospiraceae bacterium]
MSNGFLIKLNKDRFDTTVKGCETAVSWIEPISSDDFKLEKTNLTNLTQISDEIADIETTIKSYKRIAKKYIRMLNDVSEDIAETDAKLGKNLFEHNGKPRFK